MLVGPRRCHTSSRSRERPPHSGRFDPATAAWVRHSALRSGKALVNSGELPYVCVSLIPDRLSQVSSIPTMDAVLEFLNCRTPAAWIVRALTEFDTLLADHASLELKAAQQAQALIRRYGADGRRRGLDLSRSIRSRLVQKMSRLAREELRHFEQVVSLIEQRGGIYTAVSPSRYAAGLHALSRSDEPGALIDALVIGAVIEARSCERFFALVSMPGGLDPATAKFYRSLLRSEARHFEDYLALANSVDADDVAARVEIFLRRDEELVLSEDAQFRFHSGVPTGSKTRSPSSRRLTAGA